MTAVEDVTNDLGVILPDAGGVIDVEGIPAKVKRLRSREFFALIKVLVRGIGPGISEIKLDTENREQLEADMIALFTLALPNAIEEMSEFLFAVVEPVNAEDQGELNKRMVNPDPEVTMDILGLLVTQERDDLKRLWGKAQAWLAKVKPTPSPTGQ